MHYTLTVAIDGEVPADRLRYELDRIMAQFDENREVKLHRDTSVYAEDFETQYTKAIAYATKKGEDWTAVTREEMVKNWSGNAQFDTDGWPLTTSNPEGYWDWFVIGGRWSGEWSLKPGAPNGPIVTENHAFGRAPEADENGRTDNARLRDLVAESIKPTYAYVDLDGGWSTRWIGPTAEQATADTLDFTGWEVPPADFENAFLKFIQDLPADTWLVQIDYHT